MCVCAEVTEVYDAMSCLPIVKGASISSWGGSPTSF